MPSGLRLQVLETYITNSGFAEVLVRERDLYELDEDEQTSVVDVMAGEGLEPPMILVEGRFVCAEPFDLGAVVRAVEEVVGRC